MNIAPAYPWSELVRRRSLEKAEEGENRTARSKHNEYANESEEPRYAKSRIGERQNVLELGSSTKKPKQRCH